MARQSYELIDQLIADIVSCADEIDGSRSDAKILCLRLVDVVRQEAALPPGGAARPAIRCKGCDNGLPTMMLDADGTLTHFSKRPGVPSHAVDDAWWPCANWQAVEPGGAARPQEEPAP